MATEDQYWNHVRECREMVAELMLRTEQWIKRMPEIQKLLDLQERAGARLSIRAGLPGIERRRLRANVLYKGRVSRFTKIWNEKGAFTEEALNKFDHLSTVLLLDEVERMKASVNWADPRSILSGLQVAAKRLEEFWESRPGQSGAPVADSGSGPMHIGASPRPTTSRRKSRRRDEVDLSRVRILVQELRAQGCSHQEICERLGDMPRPPLAKWRDLPWPTAFRNPKYRDAVKAKLSKLAHTEISEFPQ
jgi:hypothetical protein